MKIENSCVFIYISFIYSLKRSLSKKKERKEELHVNKLYFSKCKMENDEYFFISLERKVGQHFSEKTPVYKKHFYDSVFFVIYVFDLCISQKT